MKKLELDFSSFPKMIKQEINGNALLASKGKRRLKIIREFVICKFHFKEKDMRVILDRGKKLLNQVTIPTIFSFK